MSLLIHKSKIQHKKIMIIQKQSGRPLALGTLDFQGRERE
nr:MAG TPA: hypothetical protein [Caudoviricetes sp.]